jgi:predicted hotdog family 3-hydroxylacyl-ACP dehydratase
MLLLERLVRADERSCAVQARVDGQAWYADGSGAMPGWFGLELMAQAISAYQGARGRDGGPRPGYLLGTRSYRCAVAAFPAGAVLEVTALLQDADPSGVSAFACEIRLGGEPVAQAVLKVFDRP